MQVDKRKLVQSASPIEGLALVAEGGGQRGAFTAGVLDSFQVARFNPFQILIGTSAGAQNIASYMSQQTGYAYSLISNLTMTKPFFNPWRVFTGHNVMDLDWYFAQAKKPSYQFDINQANLNSSNRIVRFSTSDPKQMATKLIDPNQEGWLKALKYSSAIPYFYKSNRLVDGGVTAPVPVNEAYQLGAKKIITIRTTLDTKNLVPTPIKKMKPLICKGGHCPNFINLLDKHEETYLNAERFIHSPPSKVTVFEIKPHQTLASKVLGSSKQDIISDYKHGFELGLEFMSKEAEQLQLH